MINSARFILFQESERLKEEGKEIMDLAWKKLQNFNDIGRWQAFEALQARAMEKWKCAHYLKRLAE